MMQKRLKMSFNRQKSYVDQRRIPLKFSADDHVFLRVTSFTSVRRAIKLKKWILKFIGP